MRKEEREEEQASSEEGCGGPGLLLPLRMASPPRPLRLLSRTGHSTHQAEGRGSPATWPGLARPWCCSLTPTGALPTLWLTLPVEGAASCPPQLLESGTMMPLRGFRKRLLL